MKNDRHKTHVKFVLIGILLGVSLFLLLGAKSQDDVVLLASDRYRVSSWGDLHSHGAFVIDSLTGKTKLVYRHFYQASGNGVADDEMIEDQEGVEAGENGNGPDSYQDHLGLPFIKIP